MHLKSWLALSLLVIAVFKRGSTNQPEEPNGAKVEPKTLPLIKSKSEVEPANPCVDTLPACSFYRRRCVDVKKLPELCPATCDKARCPKGGCSDKLWDCADSKELCGANGTAIGEVMQRECPVTCSTCDKFSTARTLYTCMDTSADCNKLAAKCNEDAVKERCGATCDGNCTTPCKDLADDCESRREHCYKMTVKGALARKECPVACGNCKAAGNSTVSLSVSFLLPSLWTYPPCTLTAESAKQAVDKETAAKNINKALEATVEEIKRTVSSAVETTPQKFPAYRRLPLEYVLDIREYEGLVVGTSEDKKDITAICPQSRMYECAEEGSLQDRQEELIMNVTGPMNQQTIEALKAAIKDALTSNGVTVKGVDEIVSSDEPPKNDTEVTDCDDKSEACSFYRRRCSDIKDLKQLCPATCNAEKCADGRREKLWDCSANNATCSVEGIAGEVMKRECPVTCNSSSPPLVKETLWCADTAADCFKAETPCNATQKERCPVTCGAELCENGCKDKATDCVERSADCYLPTVKGAIVREECPVVCGTCKVPTKPREICWETYDRE